MFKSDQEVIKELLKIPDPAAQYINCTLKLLKKRSYFKGC
jgi:hypothetical protein